MGRGELDRTVRHASAGQSPSNLWVSETRNGFHLSVLIVVCFARSILCATSQIKHAIQSTFDYPRRIPAPTSSRPSTGTSSANAVSMAR